MKRSVHNFYILAFLLLGGLSAFAQQGPIVGQPTTGAMGITVSVADIQARSDLAALQPKPIRVREETEAARHPKKDPAAPVVASWPPPDANSPTSPAGISATQAIHSNFLAATLAESNSVPPDSNGDIGSTQVCIAANGRIKFYTRNTVCQTAQTTTTGASNTPLASPTLNLDLDIFFASVLSSGVTGVSDPHVRFDRLTNKWFVIAIDLRATSNRCVIAVSSGPTVTSTSSFTFFFFVYDALTPVPPSPYAGGFFDYPTLGVDANALYIGGRMFSSTSSYTGASLFVVRKSSVTGAGPIVTTAFHQVGTGTAGIYTPQGVDNDDVAAAEGYFIGVDQGFFSRLDIYRISTPGATPTASALINVTVPATSSPLSQVSSGSAQNMDANDDRIFAAMIRKNKITGTSSLWTTHAIAVTTTGAAATSGTGRRNGTRWYQIGNMTATPTLTQSGTVFDNAATNPRGYWFPAIATSGQGHSIIGFSSASSVNFADCGVAGRYRTDAAGTQQTPVLATAASTSYNPGFDTGNPNRWGDYSQVGIDPLDDMTMWTFQEYCNGENSWGVRAIQLKAPPPATPTSPGTIGCGGINGSNYESNVTLNGASTSNSEFYDPGTGYTNRLSVTTTGTGASISNLVFVNPTQITFTVVWPPVLAGSTQTLTITNPDCQSVTTTYTLPTGCTPLPVRWISFTGREQDKKVALNWVTANEYNNKYFIVEKSVTGTGSFSEIARLNSKSDLGGSYDAVDTDPAAVNYYRLKQVDRDGSFQYSDIVVVKLTGKFSFAAYPNPARTQLTVEYTDAYRNGTVRLLNADGKQVLRRQLTGFNKMQLDVTGLSAGVYVVEITGTNGKRQQQKIVIERQ